MGEAPGPAVTLLTLGATLHGLEVTGGDGRRHDVVLGHPDVATYLESPYYLGGVVGRYANRIADGLFELDGRTVRVPVNDRGHALHGGPDGFDRRLGRCSSTGPRGRCSDSSARTGTWAFPARSRRPPPTT